MTVAHLGEDLIPKLFPEWRKTLSYHAALIFASAGALHDNQRAFGLWKAAPCTSIEEWAGAIRNFPAFFADADRALCTPPSVFSPVR